MTLTEQFPIFIARCPHRDWLLADNTAAFCEDCSDWIHGDEVATVTVEWKDDGSIAVSGSGYAAKEG